MTVSNPSPIDPVVARMIEARLSPSVLKDRLIKLRSAQPLTAIFAFEGVEDKLIYSHWIPRIRNNFSYEPFVCEGKIGVLGLFELVSNDKNDLGNKVYFFADKDFNDHSNLAGCPQLFITDAYAVENYLVCSEVVESILTVELHCHGDKERRDRVIACFKKVYAEFLELTKEVNFQLFAGKRAAVIASKDIPHVKDFIAVNLQSVSKHHEPVLRSSRELTDDEKKKYLELFDRFNPSLDYRGKFAIQFLTKWLAKLCDDFTAKPSVFFDSLGSKSKPLYAELRVGSFASRSPLPQKLHEFIMSIP